MSIWLDKEKINNLIINICFKISSSLGISTEKNLYQSQNKQTTPSENSIFAYFIHQGPLNQTEVQQLWNL